jgi:carbonic anhydrase
LDSQNVDKRIEHNKLRLVFDRRPCSDLTNVTCQEPDPPMADFPHGFTGIADAVHIDFKVPSEHTIGGQRFDAEMQIFHVLAKRRRMPVQSVLISATVDGYNYYFEDALVEFQYLFDVHSAQCGNFQRRSRQLVADVDKLLGEGNSSPYIDYQTWAEYSTQLDEPNIVSGVHAMRRNLQNAIWDPYHEMLIPSIYFWRYEGSLTEPPCGEWISWFISDKPMIISLSQLERMKNVLFNHVDPYCRRTSTQFGHSVARPIQETAGRDVWLCQATDFAPDPK